MNFLCCTAGLKTAGSWTIFQTEFAFLLLKNKIIQQAQNSGAGASPTSSVLSLVSPLLSLQAMREWGTLLWRVLARS